MQSRHFILVFTVTLLLATTKLHAQRNIQTVKDRPSPVNEYDEQGKKYGIWSLNIEHNYKMHGNLLGGKLLGHTEIYDSLGVRRLFFSVFNESPMNDNCIISNKCHLFDNRGVLWAEFSIKDGIIDSPITFFDKKGKQILIIEKNYCTNTDLIHMYNIKKFYSYKNINIKIISDVVAESEFFNNKNKRVIWNDHKQAYYKGLWYNMQPEGNFLGRNEINSIKKLEDEAKNLALKRVALAVDEINKILLLIPVDISNGLKISYPTTQKTELNKY